MGDWFFFGLPICAVGLGLVVYALAVRDSRAFDRRFGQPEKVVRDLRR